MQRVFIFGLVVLFFVPLVARAQETLPTSESAPSRPSTAEPLGAQRMEKSLEGEFDTADIAATSAWAQSLGIADWMGPLAPVALSPFFGVMCLSGLALWGPDWVTDNALLGASGPLQSQTIFFIFLGLTLLTSLPRLTKVSKPFAQAVDRLETYAVIVILLVVKISASMEPSETTEVAMIQLGVFSFTAQTLLTIAMVINIMVVNSVKFFFEFLVWLTPIPLLDAIFEVCNKTIAATLMAIYAFSPTIATVINLVVLLVAAILFRWISRRVRFFRSMVLDPVLSQLWSPYGRPKREELIVFTKSQVGPFPDKSRLRLTRNRDKQGWDLTEANWWMPAKQHLLASAPTPQVCRGWVMNRIEAGEVVLVFSRRYDADTLQALAARLGLNVDSEQSADSPSDLAADFA